MIGYTLARAGHRDGAQRTLERLLAVWRRTGEGAFSVGMVYAGLRDFDQAFDFIERSIDDRSLDPFMPPTIMEPLFADLRQDPRFDALRVKLGLQKR